MGQVIISGCSGGGVTSDDVTASRSDVLSGKTAVTVDSNDEAGTGTMPYIGSARKAIDGGLNPQGLYYHIPKGYYQEGTNDPWVYLTQPEVAAIVGAVGNKIITGQSICGVVGNVTVQSILSFNCAAYSSTAFTFTWQNPAKGAFSGVVIIGKHGSYPTSIGEPGSAIWYQGFGNNASANGLSSVVASGTIGGQTIYFRCFSYAVWNGINKYHSTTFTGSATTSKGQVILTSSGIWTVPANVRELEVFLVSGGGSGPSGRGSVSSRYVYTGGAGSGYTNTFSGVSVTPGQQISYTVGLGGASVPPSATGGDFYGKKGSATSFGNLSIEGGGKNGDQASILGASDGGSGGAFGAYEGASDGENGKFGSEAGRGQGRTTRAFEEPDNVLYAGGGGGTYNESGVCQRGAGGAGGGGKGGGGTGSGFGAPGNGTPNTGGGGGGCYKYTSSTAYPSGAGGSGVVIVRWGYRGL